MNHLVKCSQYYMVEIEAYEKSFLPLQTFQWASFCMYLTVSVSIRSLQDNFICFPKCLNEFLSHTHTKKKKSSYEVEENSTTSILTGSCILEFALCMRAWSCLRVPTLLSPDLQMLSIAVVS